MKKIRSCQSGFTIVEMLIVIGITLTLLTFVLLNVRGTQQHATLQAISDTLFADISSQQVKAITQQTKSGAVVPYGVRFEPGRYILFSGTTYNATDSSNFVVSLEQNIVFSGIQVPNSEILFASASGEIASFSPILHSVTLTSTTDNKTKNIQFNKLGVITNAQ